MSTAGMSGGVINTCAGPKWQFEDLQHRGYRKICSKHTNGGWKRGLLQTTDQINNV